MSADDESITGKLSKPTVEERAETLRLARAIIAAEQNDEEWPVPMLANLASGKPPLILDQFAVFRLAQDLADLSDLVRRYFDVVDMRARSTDATWLECRRAASDLECELLRRVR